MTTLDAEPALHARLAADIRTLALIERASASPGEETATRWVQPRLRDLGLEAEIEEFQFNPDVGTVWSPHGLAAVLSAALGLRGGGAARLGAAVGALTASSF